MTDSGIMSKRKAWLIVLVSLIDDVIILTVIGLLLWYFKVSLPLWGWIAIGLVLGGFVFVRTWFVLPSLRMKKKTGAEGMVGEVGKVVEALTPDGVVWVCGEYWQALSMDGHIDSGEEVEVLRVDRLSLEVKRRGAWET